MNHQKHIPVLLAEVLDLLQPREGDSYLDLTAGYGGHAAAVKELIGEDGSMSLVDRDKEAIQALRKVFAEDQNVEIIHNDFLAASQKLYTAGKKYDVILADLGVSSQHLNNSDRGFSFSRTGPIDMRMDRGQKFTAEEIVNKFSVDDISEILIKYGEIKRAKKLAEHIVEGRPYKNTSQLSEQIARFSGKRKKINPSTLIFQAFRIAVNNELDQLEKSLPLWLEILKPGGRLGVISFHSLEDRIVKRFFKDYGGQRYDARLHILTSKPVMSSMKEVVFNPRARSAKLRVAQRK
jgi:16S rRNA (cytosine1402-N4)-methyltransferase